MSHVVRCTANIIPLRYLRYEFSNVRSRRVFDIDTVSQKQVFSLYIIYLQQ